MFTVSLSLDCFLKKLVEHAQLQADELRRELEKGKKVLLDAFQMEKENIDKGLDAGLIDAV